MSQTQQLKIYQTFGKSSKGLVRKENQDAYSYFECVNGAVFVLCDGMGGIPGGKKAAKTAIKNIEKFFSEDWFEDEQLLIKNATEFANKQIRENLGQPESNIFPGTTIVLVLIRDNKVFYAHAGDSRIYYQTGKKMFQLTEDHSLVMKLLKEKKITKEEAENHSRKNIIYNALGINEDVDTEICKTPIFPADNDFILLCSDGLTGELSNKNILSILKTDSDIKKKGNLLIKKALEKGGNDNITVQLIQFYNTGNKKRKTYKPDSEKKKKRLILIAVFGFIFLAVNATFMFNYFFKNKNNNNFDENVENIVISYDLTLKRNYERQKTYFTGKNIYTYYGITENTIINIFKINNKKNLFFYPGEKFTIPETKKIKIHKK